MGFALSLGSCRETTPVVVVYTSLDQIFSEPVLDLFSEISGIQVRAVYDVEAVKTTGLVTRLVAERERPRADVLWSSEFAQTIGLANRGILQPYASPSAADIPSRFKDPASLWTGFACRARVLIVNTDLVPAGERPRSLFNLRQHLQPEQQVAVSNPLFGTMATHAAALHALLGTLEARSFFEDLRKISAIVDGNSVVRDQVARGHIPIGLTDTDDANLAVLEGRPVEMIFPDQDETQLGTLLIPNTVGLVAGAPHPAEGRRLIDFLLSHQVEEVLARSGSLQIPTRDHVPRPPDIPYISQIRSYDLSFQEIARHFSIAAEALREDFLK